MKLKTSEVVGCTFCTFDQVIFKVLEVEPYPASRVSARYREILSFEEGLLVAVGYRGTLIPNITVKGGVVRLTEVLLNFGEQILDRPGAISRALGIFHPMSPEILTKLP